MSTEDAVALLARGIAPVRPEFWVADPAPIDDSPVTTGGAPAGPPPSRNAARKAFNAARAAQPCRQFFQQGGACGRGDGCRFSHDPATVEAAVKARAPRLPGPCPLVDSQGGCAFGDECRWAASHGGGGGASADAPPPPPPRALDVASPLPPAVSLPHLSSLCPWPLPSRSQGGQHSLPLATSRALAAGTYDLGKADGVCAALGVAVKAVGRAAKKAKVDGGGGGPLPAATTDAAPPPPPPPSTTTTTYVETPPHAREVRPLDFKGKRYLAPLTTVGNLPFRALCVGLGAEITCGEMAMATNLLAGKAGEWALTRRHPSEKVFGVQIAAGYPDAAARAAQAIAELTPGGPPDFIDINSGCPIDLVCDKQAGAALLRRPARLEAVARAAVAAAGSVPVTLKVRKGYDDGADCVHEWAPRAARTWGLAALTIHGRSREQRYSRAADWAYVGRVARDVHAVGGAGGGEADPPEGQPFSFPIIGGGDVYTFHDHEAHLAAHPEVATTMVARGALIKPWLFTEMAERRDWDISAPERLDLVTRFASLGLGHWGSDERGVDTTRRFLLEWLSYTHRYVPLGLLSERLPEAVHPAMAWRPPPLVGRSDLETLLSSPRPSDWVRISELVLGPAPASLRFAPKHKSRAWVVPTPRKEEEGGGKAEEEDDGEENG